MLTFLISQMNLKTIGARRERSNFIYFQFNANNDNNKKRLIIINFKVWQKQEQNILKLNTQKGSDHTFQNDLNKILFSKLKGLDSGEQLLLLICVWSFFLSGVGGRTKREREKGVDFAIINLSCSLRGRRGSLSSSRIRDKSNWSTDHL